LVDTASAVKFKSTPGDARAELALHRSQESLLHREWIHFTKVNVALVLPPQNWGWRTDISARPEPESEGVIPHSSLTLLQAKCYKQTCSLHLPEVCICFLEWQWLRRGQTSNHGSWCGSAFPECRV